MQSFFVFYQQRFVRNLRWDSDSIFRLIIGYNQEFSEKGDNLGAERLCIFRFLIDEVRIMSSELVLESGNYLSV